MNDLYTIILTLCCCFNLCSLSAQQDSTRKMGFSGLPVIAAAPETGLKYGVFGQVSFDLYPNNFDSRQSQAQLGITHSVKKQLSINSDFQLFGKSEDYYILGAMSYLNWVDRHYGLGNDASNQLVEQYTANHQMDTLNFLNFGIKVFQSNISYNKKIRKGFFIGVVTNIYHSADFNPLADTIYHFPNEIQRQQMVGQYYGIGLSLTYDTRDNINNPLKGTYIQLSNLNHRKWLGADFEFSNIRLDARTYLNTYKKQILALRFATAFTFSDAVIPFTGYQRLGGKQSLRGYFEGTFLDRHSMVFDVEYRLPLFQDEDAPVWKIWKHFGMAFFASVGQVFGEQSDFSLSQFHYSAGGGIRIMLSKTQRTNIRVDYGLGFSKNAGGQGQQQRGLYITVNEAF